jgi:uncharacterized membrane protein YphA (DoxX/SURF4 family)
MATVTAVEPPQLGQETAGFVSRTGLRFCVVYFTLFAVSNQIIGGVFPIPKVDVPDPGTLWPVRPLVFWIGAHLFGMKTPLVYSGSGSGDKNYDWVLLFCIFVFAAVATGVWSLIDRKPRAYSGLWKWFWLSLRICLGGQMLIYGFVKAFPLQMHFPFLSVLMEPFGNFSPSSVLWFSVGAEPAYESITGCAELLGGLLLVLPRTVTLGGLICLADMTMVFILNMTYDVPVKLLSFNLILMSLLVLAPDFSRLANFFVLGRATELPQRTPLFKGRRAQRIASAVLAFLWLWMIGNNLYGVYDNWHQYGPAAPKSPLYGIWNIQTRTVDGKDQPLLVTEEKGWRRLLFESPEYMQVQCMDESGKGYGLALDQKKGTLALTDGGDKNWKAAFTFVRPAPDRLSLNGTVAGRKTTLELQRIDEKKLQLLSRGFHWIQDYPYYR